FGTPLLGTAIANFLSSTSQARALTPAEANDYLQLLINSTQEFTEKRETLGCPELLLYAGYEEKDTLHVRVVPQPSAAFAVPPDRTKGFPKDHREMVKPADRTDDAYKWVQGVLKECRSNGGRCGQLANARCGRPPWLPLQ